MTDTVGFIRKLPHQLIESFKSTLDEVVEADFLIHLVDISNPNFEDHINVVNKTLVDIGVKNTPTVLVFNKIDQYSFIEKDPDDLTPVKKINLSLEELQKTWISKINLNTIFISALQKKYYDEFKLLLYDEVKKLHEKRYPYNNFLY